MRIRYNFNMVEIALATAVIAIGISSILVLFPIGINATRAAIEENCYSDAVETLLSIGLLLGIVLLQIFFPLLVLQTVIRMKTS